MESEGFTWKQWIFIWAIPVLFFVAVAGFKSVKLPVAPVANTVVSVPVKKVPDMFAEFPPEQGVKRNMADYIVSGAGSSEWNGTYVDQGGNTYKLDDLHWLSLDSNGNWCLGPEASPAVVDEAYVSTGTSSYTPDVGAWSAVNGSPPAPTVDLVVAAKDNIMVSGAGYPGVNGEYQYHASGYPFGGGEYWEAIDDTYGLMIIHEDSSVYYIEDDGGFQYYSVNGDITGTWVDLAGYEPVPTASWVTAPVPDETAPTFESASINADGDQLTVNWTETESVPVTGNTGLSLGGLTHGAATLSNVTTTGTTTTADISRTITVDETPTLSYAPGNFADSADTPNAVASFSGESVTNGSTQPWDAVSPAVASGAVSSNGNTITLTFTEAKSPPILPATGITGFSFRKGSGESLVTGNGTRATPLTVTFNVTGDIYSTDSIYCDYEDGNVTDSASPANNLANFSDLLLTNNASEGDPSMVTREFNVVTASGVTDSYDAGASTDKGYCCHLHVIGVNGTTPTLDVTIEHSDDDTNYEDLVTFDQVTTNGAWRSVSTSDTAEIKRYRRVNYTIGGTDPEIVMLVTAGTKK